MMTLWARCERAILRLIAVTDLRVAHAAVGTCLWMCIIADTALASDQARKPAEVPAKAVIDTAQRFLGVPYVYGSRAGLGLDCSGFVQKVYAEHGITLPRTSSEMSSVGDKVAWDKLEPGDLLFFHTSQGSKRVSHVGIAMGHGKMIHASTGQKRIAIDSLDLDYYKLRRVVARRLPSVHWSEVAVTKLYRPATTRELLHVKPMPLH